MTTPSPSIPDFLSGFGPQQPDWQSQWVNAAAFFQQRVVFRATQTTTATTLPSSGAVTVIAYDNIIEDTYGGWNSGSHLWTPPVVGSGWYQVTVTVFVTAPGATGVYLSPYVQAAAALDPYRSTPLVSCVIPNAPGGAEGTWYVYLAGGLDTVSGAGSVQNSAGNVTCNLTAGQQSSMEIVWIGS